MRAIEYLVLRTDETFIGEAIIHKLIGILFLAFALKMLDYKWSSIGFKAKDLWRKTFLGFVFGTGVYVIAYSVEMIIQAMAGNSPKLEFFVTGYAITGNRVLDMGILSVAICIIGNIVNVIMEEGVFRGLFNKLVMERFSFFKACMLSSALFGFWHIAQPIRNVIDGSQSVPGAVMASIILVATSALLGVQYSMIWRMTGSLWIGMAAHFVNNAGINLLHITTSGGVDELQVVRITIAQTLSFLIVLVLFLRYKRNENRRKNGEVVH